MSPLRIAALLATVLALLLFVTGVILCVQPYRIASVSMEDTVLRGDRVLVDKIGARLGREPKIGDLVAHRYPPNPTRSRCSPSAS